MKNISIFITVISALMTLLTWGDAECYAWIVATTGWASNCFEDKQ